MIEPDFAGRDDLASWIAGHGRPRNASQILRQISAIGSTKRIIGRTETKNRNQTPTFRSSKNGKNYCTGAARNVGVWFQFLSKPTDFRGKPYQSIPERAKQIAKNGVDTGSAVELPDGRIIVTGGNSRLAAMKLLNEKTMPLKVVKWTELPPMLRDILRTNYPGLSGAP